MSERIAKTPKLIVINIRNTKETVVCFPTVSVKKRGTNWNDPETVTLTALDWVNCGKGKTLAEAKKDLFRRWENYTREEYGESVYIETSDSTWVTLKQ